MNLLNPNETHPIGDVKSQVREIPFCLKCGSVVGIGDGGCTYNCIADRQPRDDSNTTIIVSRVTWEVTQHKPFSTTHAVGTALAQRNEIE